MCGESLSGRLDVFADLVSGRRRTGLDLVQEFLVGRNEAPVHLEGQRLASMRRRRGEEIRNQDTALLAVELYGLFTDPLGITANDPGGNPQPIKQARVEHDAVADRLVAGHGVHDRHEDLSMSIHILNLAGARCNFFAHTIVH